MKRLQRLIAAAGWVGLASCTTSSEEGLHVVVGVQAAPPEATTFTTDLDYEVTVTKGFVAVASTSIRACSGVMAAHASPDRTWAEAIVAPFRIKSAWAHSTSSPTTLGVPGVLPLAPSAVVEAELGELKPPPATYCATRVQLGPADRDALLLPDDSMVGLTLLVEGSWTASGGEPVPFAWSSSATPAADHQTRFELAKAGTTSVEEVIRLSFEEMFDGLDLATIDPDIGADRAAARLVETLRIEVR